MARRLLTAREGAVAVETALVCGLLLVPLLLGLWDVAQIATSKAKIDQALQDAITYVASGQTDTAGITSAAQAAYGSSVVVPTPSTVCYCVKTTTTSPTAPTTATCGGSCAAGSSLQQFLSISVNMAVTMPFSVPYLGSSTTVTSTGLVRTG